jgi:hypothetical protein
MGNPFASVRRRTARMQKRSSHRSNRSNHTNHIEDEERRYITRARTMGFNPAVAHATLARDKYIQSCAAKGVKPDPKELEKLQQRIFDEISLLRGGHFSRRTTRRRF